MEKSGVGPAAIAACVGVTAVPVTVVVGVVATVFSEFFVSG